ncbi:hypothetical protein AB0K14_07500 [Actinosynnema sp. NPDC050801]|uniref:hypothetical protein n=1 Tax=unclassified Actinosynnema TaxID=2637065 RepID=UPI0034080A02
MRNNSTVRRLAVGVLTAAGLMATSGIATAAPEAESGNVGIQGAVLGHICDGPFGNIEKFVIISDGGIPAGSSWVVSTSRNPSPYTFKAVPDSALVQTTRISQSSVKLLALATIPDGTVVKVQPTNFYTNSVLSISGYGGSDSSAPWC